MQQLIITEADRQRVRDELEEAGEDLRDYPNYRIDMLIQEGFLDD